MSKARLEAFSDGVIAIIITIMVLELKVPHGHDLDALVPLVPVFFSYVLSFTFVGIYWNNHHHLLHAAKRSTPALMWANLHLLFWLSLIPFVTGWMGESLTPVPTALYGAVMAMAGGAYKLLSMVAVSQHGEESKLAQAIGNDLKGFGTFAGCVVAIPLAFVSPWISIAMYVVLAAVWLIPDSRIAGALESN